jgi:hypothetical protein
VSMPVGVRKTFQHDMPAPSPQLVPSAEAPKALHRPSVANACWRLNSMNKCGVDITQTPPATAIAISPRSSDWLARCSATREDAQAASIDSAGPCSPNV